MLLKGDAIIIIIAWLRNKNKWTSSKTESFLFFWMTTSLMSIHCRSASSDEDLYFTIQLWFFAPRKPFRFSLFVFRFISSHFVLFIDVRVHEVFFADAILGNHKLHFWTFAFHVVVVVVVDSINGMQSEREYRVYSWKTTSDLNKKCLPKFYRKILIFASKLA